VAAVLSSEAYLIGMLDPPVKSFFCGQLRIWGFRYCELFLKLGIRGIAHTMSFSIFYETINAYIAKKIQESWQKMKSFDLGQGNYLLNHK
jgi:hypothetical protein